MKKNILEKLDNILIKNKFVITFYILLCTIIIINFLAEYVFLGIFELFFMVIFPLATVISININRESIFNQLKYNNNLLLGFSFFLQISLVPISWLLPIRYEYSEGLINGLIFLNILLIYILIQQWYLIFDLKSKISMKAKSILASINKLIFILLISFFLVSFLSNFIINLLNINLYSLGFYYVFLPSFQLFISILIIGSYNIFINLNTNFIDLFEMYSSNNNYLSTYTTGITNLNTKYKILKRFYNSNLDGNDLKNSKESFKDLHFSIVQQFNSVKTTRKIFGIIMIIFTPTFIFGIIMLVNNSKISNTINQLNDNFKEIFDKGGLNKKPGNLNQEEIMHKTNIEDQLIQLKELLEKRLITKDEYDSKRKQILEKY